MSDPGAQGLLRSPRPAAAIFPALSRGRVPLEVIAPDRWLRDFERLEIRDEVRPKILKRNAARLLGLGG